MINITCKNEEADNLNKIVEAEIGTYGEKNDLRLWFWTEQEYIDWAKEINENEKHHNRHLKPDDRELTVDELKKMFSSWPVNSADLDPKFGRCPNEYLMKTLGFLVKHKKQLAWVNLKDLYGREMDEKKIAIAEKELEKSGVLLDDPDKKPVVLNPDWEKEKEEMPQSGIVECRSWSQNDDRRSWILFGNVEEPNWMHEKKYLSGCPNNIYRNKENETFMLIPLMPLGVGFSINDQYSRVRKLGCYISYVAFMQCYNTEIPKLDHRPEKYVKNWFTLLDFETTGVANKLNASKFKPEPVLINPTNRGNIHIINLGTWNRDQVLILFYMIVVNNLPKTHPAWKHLVITQKGLDWWIKKYEEVKIEKYVEEDDD